MNSDNGWISLHIYFKGDINVFLRQILFPLAKLLKKEKILDQYFFIRYFEGGQHIRFRVSTSEPVKVKAYLIAFFNKLTNPGIPGIGLVSTFFIDYVPETERYGGAIGIEACEAFFCDTSELISEKIIESKNFDTGQAISTAIAMNLFFLYALAFSNEQAIDFFNLLMNSWMESSEEFLSQYYGGNTDVKAIHFYEKSYDTQKDVIDEIVKEITCAMSDHSKASWLNKYKEKVLKLKNRINMINEESKLGIIASLLHMSNNRLGLNNMDESFLYYILIRSLEKRRIFDE